MKGQLAEQCWMARPMVSVARMPCLCSKYGYRKRPGKCWASQALLLQNFSESLKCLLCCKVLGCMGDRGLLHLCILCRTSHGQGGEGQAGGKWLVLEVFSWYFCESLQVWVVLHKSAVPLTACEASCGELVLAL